MNSLVRLYDIQEGKILINGIDTKKISLKELRSRIVIFLKK